MKNYIDAGNTVTVPAPAVVASGGGVLVGTMFGVAQADAALAAPVVLVLRGAYVLPKATGAVWTLGAGIYWDDTAKSCTTTASGNILIGKAIVAAGAADTVGSVRLNG